MERYLFDEMDSEEYDEYLDAMKIVKEMDLDVYKEEWDLESARIIAEKAIKEKGGRREIIGIVEMKKGGKPVRTYTSRVLTGKNKGWQTDTDPLEIIVEKLWKGMEFRVKELMAPVKKVVDDDE